MDEDELARQQALWRERYGDMVPEKIVDTKIGPDGKRYYKVQWAATTMEPGKNFLEAELLIKKYWDPVEKRLKFPSEERQNNEEGQEAASSSSSNNDENNESENVIENKCDEKPTSSSSNSEILNTDDTANNSDENDNQLNDTKENEDSSESIENKIITETNETSECSKDSKLKRKRSIETHNENEIEQLNDEVLSKKTKEDSDVKH